MWGRLFGLGSLLVMLWTLTPLASAAELHGVRVWPSPDNTRVVFDLSKPAEYSYFALKNPDRLVFDFKSSSKQVDLSGVADNSDLIKKVRTSKAPKKGTLRIVLDLKRALKPKVFALKPTEPYGDRVVVDLYDQKKKPVVITNNRADQKREIVIAIDAGHGGEDPGSIGGRGIYEKKVTLEISRRLAKLIDAEKGMKALMVRTGDYYVGLNRRSDLARQHGADLLLSIHADAFTSPGPRGASVWYLSNRRAKTEIGRWLEKTEKHSELLGGAGEVLTDTKSEKYLTQTLLDMSMDNSRATGFEVSKDILHYMGKVTKLHKKEPVSASLAVLKSPDIPSLLIETGFISNPQEEKLLNTKSHQQKLAQAIFNGVHRYFRNTPPEGTLFAALNPRTHTVKSGESLSVLAQRYNTSVTQLKKTNKLKSDMLRIGQVLTIPST
ncbi:N-acetylmuramoyl-L-alanine amidase [Corallincola platygyrae]|uniref:N-acetylmuramoyl-L-alanine amidase n=1 Tax=Corallincola platygyrae TaxID=1193278 RepID=A0ABW4XLT5_9GAMM